MKITKRQLKQLIKEELQKVLQEGNPPDMATMAQEAGRLRLSANVACGRKAAQLEATLKTGDSRFLKQAYEQAKEFQRCEQGTKIEYSIEAIANNIGHHLDRTPA